MCLAYQSGKKTIISTLGNEIDITPSLKHTSVNKNPGPYGEVNTSVDILDAEGNIKLDDGMILRVKHIEMLI